MTTKFAVIRVYELVDLDSRITSQVNRWTSEDGCLYYIRQITFGPLIANTYYDVAIIAESGPALPKVKAN